MTQVLTSFGLQTSGTPPTRLSGELFGPQVDVGIGELFDFTSLGRVFFNAATPYDSGTRTLRVTGWGPGDEGTPEGWTWTYTLDVILVRYLIDGTRVEIQTFSLSSLNQSQFSLPPSELSFSIPEVSYFDSAIEVVYVTSGQNVAGVGAIPGYRIILEDGANGSYPDVPWTRLELPDEVTGTFDIRPDTAQIFVDETVLLVAYLDDVALVPEMIEWDSDNSAIATVSSGGLVTGVSVATVAISGLTSSLFDESVITVVPEPETPILTVTGFWNRFELSWIDQSPGITTGYIIEKRLYPDEDFGPLIGIPDPNIIILDDPIIPTVVPPPLPPRYCYRIQATGVYANSDFSDEECDDITVAIAGSIADVAQEPANIGYFKERGESETYTSETT